MMLDWVPMVGRFGVGPGAWVAGGRMEDCAGGSDLGRSSAGCSGETSFCSWGTSDSAERKIKELRCSLMM